MIIKNCNKTDIMSYTNNCKDIKYSKLLDFKINQISLDKVNKYNDKDIKKNAWKIRTEYMRDDLALFSLDKDNSEFFTLSLYNYCNNTIKRPNKFIK